MEFMVLLIILVMVYVLLGFLFDINIEKLKQIGENTELNKITEKYPDNIEICKEYLKILNNNDVNIEEDKKSNTTLYLVASNKIFIANLKDSYTRIQTIAHECLHSVQNRKMLWFNFIFSNLYILFFVVVCVLGILKVIKCKMFIMSLMILFGFVYFIIRAFLENDAMIKARYLSEKYMRNKKISSEEDIEKVLFQYDLLNDIGIKYTNIQIFKNVIIKLIILAIIFMF